MVAQLDRTYVDVSHKKALVRLVSYVFFEGRPLTTRGQWINPLVLRLGRWIANRRGSPHVTAPIYVLGQGRSGTTILGLTLSLHRSVGFLNEPKALWHVAYRHEDLLGNFTEQPARYALSKEDATIEVQMRIRRLYSAFLRCTNSRRILDKYPELVFRVPFVLGLFPDARFLLVVRNGWHVCRSIEAWSKQHRKENAIAHDDWWGRNDRKWRYLVDQVAFGQPDLSPYCDQLRHMRRDRDRAALEWILTMRTVRAVHLQFPQNTLLVRYESLIANPASSLAQILHFCSLDSDERVTRYAEKVLRERLANDLETIELDELVRAPFVSMMKELGYLT